MKPDVCLGGCLRDFQAQFSLWIGDQNGHIKTRFFFFTSADKIQLSCQVDSVLEIISVLYLDFCLLVTSSLSQASGHRDKSKSLQI